MALTPSDIQRLAQLARLRVSPEQSDAVLNQLNDVFGLIEQLRAAPTEGVAPMTHLHDMSLRLRADEVSEANHREAYQQPAPLVERGLYLVPKVIE
jgi:aspartyl-tRNA(Asn)/glutamyl-tRNA(Gln) amidotransferase subunit C